MSCPVDFLARRRLCEHIDAADSWITRCKAAVGKEARDLKKLLSLANEADAMPIRLAHECSVLAGAISSAQDWMK